MTSYTWTGSAGDNSWDNASNWSPSNNFPVNGDTVTIAPASSYPIWSTGVVTLAALTIAATAALTISGGGIKVSGATDNKGALNLSGGKLESTGTFTNESSGDIVVSGTKKSTIEGSSISNAGTIQIDSGATLSANKNIGNTGSLVLSGGKLDDSNGVTNTGAGSVSGIGEITGAVSGGTVEAQGSGTLTLDAATTASKLQVDTGATLSLGNGGAVGSVGFANGATGATLDIGSGDLTVSGDVSVSAGNTLTLGGGVLNSAGLTDDGTVSGYGTINGPVDQGSGVLEASGGLLTVSDALMGGLNLEIGSGSDLSLSLGGSAASAAFTSGSGGQLSLASQQSLNLQSEFAIGDNSVNMGADSYLNSTAGFTIAGGSVTGGILDGGPVSGYGTIGADIWSGSVTASGGALTLTGDQEGNDLYVAANSSLLIDGPSSGDINSLNFTNANSGSATIEASVTVDSAVVLNAGNTLTLSNASLTDTAGVHLKGGALDIVGSGGLGSGTNVTGYGSIDPLNGDVTVTASGGELVINGPVDQSGAAGKFVIGPGGTLDFTGPVGTASIHPTVDFTGSGVTLIDSSTENFGVITGFAKGDAIDLTQFAGGSVTVNGETATFTKGSSTETLTFSSGTDLSDLKLDSSGDLTICFMPGTMIRTPDGEVAVETLKPGDLVATHLGEAKPVNWVGRQTVARRFSTPLRNWPVRVKAGALGPQTPVRDLLLSPDHALWVDGILIQAGALVNGTSVVRETVVPEVWTYYHVELDDHSLILADGAPAETFVDNVDRLYFDNWAEYEALYPDGKPVKELPYPRAKAHRQVPVDVRVRMAERALEIGAAETGAQVA